MSPSETLLLRLQGNRAKGHDFHGLLASLSSITANLVASQNKGNPNIDPNLL